MKRIFLILTLFVISLSFSSCRGTSYLGLLSGFGGYYLQGVKSYKPPFYDLKTLDKLCKDFDDRADACFRLAQNFQIMKNPKMYEYYELAIKNGLKTKLSPEELVKYYDDKYTKIINNKDFNNLDCNSLTKDVLECYYYNRYSQNYLRCQKVEKTISTYYAKYEKLKAKYEELTNPNNPCNQKNADKKDCLSKTYIQALKNDYKKCENYLRKYGWFLD